MNATTKTLALAVIVTLGHLGIVPSAYAITISVAEVRGDAAYVKGSDAGRKQQILWEGVYVTTAKGSGNFSFEGNLPAICVEGNCVGTLTAGETVLDVPLDFPGEPPGEPAQLALLHEQPDAHGGDAVRAVGFVANGEQWEIVSGGENAQIRNWDYNLSEYEARGLDHTIYDIDVRTDIFSTGEGGWNGHANSPTLRLWEASGLPLTQAQVPIGFVYSVAISPDKNWTAASGFYGDIVVYRNRSNNLAPFNLELIDTTATKKKRTRALTFSPDGGVLASASTGGIHLWSFPQGCAYSDCQLDALLTLNHSGSWSFPIAFAPDSIPERIELVSGTDSGTTKFWIIENLATENQTASFHSVESGAVYALAWSPDGNMIVAGGNRTITVYDSTNGSILFQNEDAHAGRVNDVAFSPDNSLIVSGGADGALKLWTIPAP